MTNTTQPLLHCQYCWIVTVEHEVSVAMEKQYTGKRVKMVVAGVIFLGRLDSLETCEFSIVIKLICQYSRYVSNLKQNIFESSIPLIRLLKRNLTISGKEVLLVPNSSAIQGRKFDLDHD